MVFYSSYWLGLLMMEAMDIKFKAFLSDDKGFFSLFPSEVTDFREQHSNLKEKL